MRIGFDGKRAVNNLTGLGNYSRLVIEAVADADSGEVPGGSYNASSDATCKTSSNASSKASSDVFPRAFGGGAGRGNELLVYAPEMRANPLLAPIKARGNVEFRFPGQVGFRGSLWRTFGITNHLLADKIDVYHGLSNELPLNIRKGGVKAVVTIHDVIYRRLPHCYNRIDRELYDFKYGRSARNADRVIAISERTKQDVMELYGVPEDRIDVVYQGCDDNFRRELSAEELRRIRDKYNLPERYVVQVGTIEWRKNLALTAAAMAALPGDVKLFAVGRDRKGYKKEVMEQARRYGVADRIIFPGSVDFCDLPAVYRMASVAALPSRYEGFGIPVIEAMECEVPFVGATGSCLEEAGGPSGFYVNPDSVEEMGETLKLVLEGGEDIERRVREGKEYVKKFSNRQMGENLMRVYRHTLEV